MKKSSGARALQNENRIFELLRAYHRSRENIRLLLDVSDMALDEKMGFIDAWQEEMADFFAENGYCFACNRLLERCACEEPIRSHARSKPA
jgi:hypothetical protein